MSAFESRVEASISAAHHNGPPGNKCENNHGHDWHVIVSFYYKPEDLNQYGWGPEFGAVKDVIRSFDHGVNGDLNAMMAPLPPSAENFAARLAADIAEATGRLPVWVEVHESAGNVVRFYP